MSQDWLTHDGYVVHPTAPRGGGGAGSFRSPKHFGGDDNGHGIPHPNSPAGRNAVLNQHQVAALKAHSSATARGGRGALPLRMLQSMATGQAATPIQVDELMIFDLKDDRHRKNATDYVKSHGGAPKIAAEGVTNVFDLGTTLMRYHLLKQLTFYTHGYPGQADLTNGQEGKGLQKLDETALGSVATPKDLFAGEGQLLFLGCAIAEDKKGEDFLVAAGKYFFGGKGGMVAGSNVTTYSESDGESYIPNIVGDSSHAKTVLGVKIPDSLSALVVFHLDGAGKMIKREKKTPLGFHLGGVEDH